VTTVRETIPEPLQPEVDAAIAWFNRSRDDREGGAHFEVTGIVDPEDALASDGPRDLRLVLCAGDRCEQRTFRVSTDASGFSVALADELGMAARDPDSTPAELDPPPGARRSWLDAALARHAFIVLIFYRGFW